MRNVLHSSTRKCLICVLTLAGGAFFGLLVPASPSNASAFPQKCTLDQRVIRTYYTDSTFLHQDCVEITAPEGCKTGLCDPTPYFKDSCGSICTQ